MAESFTFERIRRRVDAAVAGMHLTRTEADQLKASIELCVLPREAPDGSPAANLIEIIEQVRLVETEPMSRVFIGTTPARVEVWLTLLDRGEEVDARIKGTCPKPGMYAGVDLVSYRFERVTAVDTRRTVFAEVKVRFREPARADDAEAAPSRNHYLEKLRADADLRWTNDDDRDWAAACRRAENVVGCVMAGRAWPQDQAISFGVGVDVAEGHDVSVLEVFRGGERIYSSSNSGHSESSPPMRPADSAEVHYTVEVITKCATCHSGLSGVLSLRAPDTRLHSLTCHACGDKNVAYVKVGDFQRHETITPEGAVLSAPAASYLPEYFPEMLTMLDMAEAEARNSRDFDTMMRLCEARVALLGLSAPADDDTAEQPVARSLRRLADEIDGGVYAVAQYERECDIEDTTLAGAGARTCRLTGRQIVKLELTKVAAAHSGGATPAHPPVVAGHIGSSNFVPFKPTLPDAGQLAAEVAHDLMTLGIVAPSLQTQTKMVIANAIRTTNNLNQKYWEAHFTGATGQPDATNNTGDAGAEPMRAAAIAAVEKRIGIVRSYGLTAERKERIGYYEGIIADLRAINVAELER